MTNQDILDQLRQASQGLLFTSESDYPFEVFLWELPVPELTPTGVLAQLGKPGDTPIEQVTLEEELAIALTPEPWHSPEERQSVQQYRDLVTTLKRTLTQVQVYRVGQIQIDILIVGKTPAQAYAGLATKVVET